MDEVRDLACRARMAGLSGDFKSGHEMLEQAGTFVGDDDVGGRASIAIERGRLRNSAGFPSEAFPSFLEAWELARHAGDHNLAVDAAHMLAIVSDVEGAEYWTPIALDYIAAGNVSPHGSGMLQHNLGWTYFEAGCFEAALACFRKDEAIREASGTAQTLKIARYAVIRTLRAMSCYDEAIGLGERVISLADAANDQAPYVCAELAECPTFKGNFERARHFAERAHTILAGNAFGRNEPERLARLASLAGMAAR